jgi:beta-lactamase class D
MPQFVFTMPAWIIQTIRIIWALCVVLGSLATQCPPVHAQTAITDTTLGRFFKSQEGKRLEGAFVVYDMKNDVFTRYNPARCKQRYSPFSTFKIPNSLIGLETGAIPDTSTVINWDRKKYPAQEYWQRDFPEWMDNQTMRTALRYSVVWYYRELAKRVGERDMKRYVDMFGYGNRDISGGIFGKNTMDAFWLGSSLLISADEQVEFLRAFYTRQLPDIREYAQRYAHRCRNPTLSAVCQDWRRLGQGNGKVSGVVRRLC